MTENLRDQLAIALQYEKGSAAAPRVVATGRGLVGQRIIQAAEAHGVPIERNAPLAQALSSIELDDEIPEQLYVAVAEILAFVLRAAGQRS